MPYRTSRTEPTDSGAAGLDWSLALAGGEGTRLADYVERRFGNRMPKQYCRLLGSRSMLEHTLDRLNALVPPSRTLTVIGADHARLAAAQTAGRCDHVFRQPASRETGLAIYVALAMISRWHPNAVVTITPTDHYVAPAERYIEHVAVARAIAARLRETIVLLGVQPTEPDPELGYLALGARISEAPARVQGGGEAVRGSRPRMGVPELRAAARFIEKPDVVRACNLVRRGALWNTAVACGSVRALWSLAREVQPQLVELCEALVPLVGTPDEDDAIDYIYSTLPPISFSRDVLERAPGRLAVLELDGVEWSDWGRPERVETTIAMRRSRALIDRTAPSFGGAIEPRAE